jgi:PadR family transcriptional regulator PadR
LHYKIVARKYLALQSSVVPNREVKGLSIRTQLLKGVLDGCILAIIDQEEVYGYELSKKLEQVGLDISEGTIYPVLLRLQKNGYVIGEMRASDSGPNRKYYSITQKGKEVLGQIREEWKILSGSIEKLLGE